MSVVRCLPVAAIIATLAACSPGAQQETAEPGTSPAASATGLDLAGIDQSVAPGDDFFKYANGNWLATAKIPADRASTGTFLLVYERTQERITGIIQHAADSNPAPGSAASQIADYYAAYMNTQGIEQHGLQPLQAQLDSINGVQSRLDLARVLGSRLRQDVDPVNATDFHTNHLFGLFVAQGLTDPSHNIAYLLQGGLTMPSRDYYLSDNATMADYRDKYKNYIVAMLTQAHIENASAAAERVFALEMKIAAAQSSLVESQDIQKANNLWTLAEFNTKAPGMDWDAYFAAAGLSSQKVIDVWQPAAFGKLSRLVAEAPLESWQALLTFHTLDRYAPLLPKTFADLAFQFHGQTLNGVPEQRERAKRAVDATSGALGMAVGKLYVEKYFPASAKKKAEQLVANIIAAFRSRLDQLAWMTPATREKAAAKLATLKVQVGYPDHWPASEGLTITADDPLSNAINVEKFHYQQRLSVLGKPVNPDHWWMTPQLVNAINLPLQNKMQFPAAILQPPFFNPEADAAHNYGAIGAVIGHEISHSFDNLGAQFDAQGRLHNWWTAADAEHFEQAAQALAEQYNQYEALPGLFVNGQQTLGENIADVSGLTAAYIAYHKALAGKPAPVIDGFSGDQRFFLSFAQTWRSKMRAAALRQRVKTDVHAPPQFRAQTVRNLDAWYDAFDVTPDARQYLPPEQRVQIW